MIRVSTAICTFFTATLGLWSIGCTDKPWGCPPGLQSACPCAGSEETGVQVCAEDGLSWSECVGCPSDSTCEPGEVQACLCLGGGLGVQTCEDDGAGWKDCEGCNGSSDGDTDTDDDTSGKDTDEDAGMLDTECVYNDCEGDVCEAQGDCCDESECGSRYFSSSNYIENYCYPTCEPDAEEDQCKCGDVCVDRSGTGFCLGTGQLILDRLTLPVGATAASSVMVDASDVTFTAEHDGEALSLAFFEAYWREYSDETRRLEIWSQADNGNNTAWILGIYIPEDIFNQGVGEYDLYDSSNDETNFYAALYFGVYDSSYSFTELWRENVPLAASSVLSIDRTCEACTAESSECESCVFSVNVSWIAVRGKLSLD